MLKKKRAQRYTKKRCIIRIEYSSGTSRYLQVNKFQKNAVYLSRAVMAHAKTVNIIKPTDYERFNNLYAFSHIGTGRRGAVRNRPCIPQHATGFPTVLGKRTSKKRNTHAESV